MGRKSEPAETLIEETAQRLDVWLYRARFLKTRGMATRLVSKGKLRLTRHGEILRVKKPGFRVAAGDTLAFMRGSTLLQVEILNFPQRRGPAAEARASYILIDGENVTASTVDK